MYLLCNVSTIHVNLLHWYFRHRLKHFTRFFSKDYRRKPKEPSTELTWGQKRWTKLSFVNKRVSRNILTVCGMWLIDRLACVKTRYKVHETLFIQLLMICKTVYNIISKWWILRYVFTNLVNFLFQTVHFHSEESKVGCNLLH